MRPDLRKFYFFLCCLFLFSAADAHAQQEKERIDQLNAKSLRFLGQPDSLILFGTEAYDLSRQLGYRAGEGLASKFLGIANHRKSNFDKAISYYENSLKIFTELNNPLEVAKANLNIATSYNSRLDFVKSVTYGMRALKIFEQLNEPNGQGRVLNLLGVSASSGKDFNAAKNFFLQYSALVKRAKDTIEIATSYNNLGSTYTALKKPDSAIYFLKMAAALHKKKNNLKGLGTVYQNIGKLYHEKEDFKTALYYQHESRKIYEEIGDRKFLSHSYYNIGAAYKKLKDTVNAKPWLLKALDVASDVGEKQIIMESNKSLADLSATGNQFKEAYEKLQVAMGASDSILNVGKSRIIEELQAKYQAEKKEAKIRELNQQSTIQKLQIRQRNISLAVAAGMLLAVLLITYLVINRRKLKERSRMQIEINKQQDIAARSVLDAEERERRRIASDLHDGVGQLLSAALMNLNGLFGKVKLEGEEGLQAERSLSLVNESYDEMRSISHQMMPNALLKAGLATAVKEFLHKIDQDKIRVSLEVVGLKERLNEQVETVLYRVIQETVTNVIKHANASKLTITLIKDEEGIAVNVEDNGKGFDKSRVKDSDGIGMSSIFTRVEFLKGTVDIDSSPGKGTLVAIHIPA